MFSLRADDDHDTFLGFFSDLRDFFTGHAGALSEFDPEAGSGGEGDGFWLRPRLIGADPSGALRGRFAPREVPEMAPAMYGSTSTTRRAGPSARISRER